MTNRDYYDSGSGYGYGNTQQETLYRPHPESAYKPHSDTSYTGTQQRLDATPPGAPYNDSEIKPSVPSKSPFNTPFDDRYDSYNPSSQSINEYSYNSQGRSHDPFHDNNAIPLQNQPYSSTYPESPTTQMANAEQQKFPYNQPQERIKPKQKTGWFARPIPFAVYFLSLVMFIVFIVEIVKNAQLTGSPIETKPQFNVMIGPSPYVLINMGARYVPCMRKMNALDGLTVAQVNLPCPNTTTSEAQCSLQELCGFGMNLAAKADGSIPQPNQWWRFITPIFLHGGIIHIGFNMLLQLTLGKDIERQIGTVRFVLVYFSAGIFGFVFGGNFAPNGIPSMGCSGSLFGILAIVLLDLLYTWKSRKSPVRELLFIGLDVVLAFVIGLLPGLDNFSHIGGFITGIILGICILRSPDQLRERIGLDDPPYATVSGQPAPDSENTAIQNFVRQPVGFFKGRKPLWWVWWAVRAGAAILVLIAFILLIKNFYSGKGQCGWCKYLSCLPVKDWCNVGNLEFTKTETSPNPSRRMFL